MDIEEKHSTRETQHKSSSNTLIWIVLIIVVGAGSFYGGVTYEKGHRTTVASNGSNNAGFRGGFGGGFGDGDRVFGDVTAISSSSITVQNGRTGTNTTLAITSSTEITDDGQTATTSNIQTGDEVFVTENSSDTSQASRIMVNPSFGGGGQQSGGGDSSTSGTTD